MEEERPGVSVVGGYKYFFGFFADYCIRSLVVIDTWVSCEEAPNGVIWQVDPMGGHKSEMLTMGSYGGRWESFTYDISDLNAPHFFVTEDHARGALSKL